MPVAYDAFISYSHARDKPIAAALQLVVQRLGKAWHQRRVLRVFRDDTSLSAAPGLWPAIEQALDRSQYLILLTSPEAAASRWVNKEVAYWLEHKSADTLLIALTDGALAWDDARGAFAADAPLPPALAGQFSSEPKWVDLTAFRDPAAVASERFTELAADLAAAVRGVPKEDLLSQELREQRRALRLAWLAASTLLVFAAAAVWQWRAAVEQRNRAERSLAVATDTANTLVFDLAQELRDRAGMPIALVRKILDRAEALQRQLADSRETTPDLRRSESVALNELAEAFVAQGDVARALAAAERSRAVMTELVASNPDNTKWQRDLSISHDRLGEVLLLAGRREEALGAYRKSFVIRERLALADPGNPDWQRDLAISHDNIGSVLLTTGGGEDALASYRKGLAIKQALASRDPANGQWQRDLAKSHEFVGEVLITLGRREEGFVAYQQSLAIGEKLVVLDP